MSRDVTQAEVFTVLRDRIAADGAPCEELRQWVAQELVGMRLAGPWELHYARNGVPGNPQLRGWVRRWYGGQRPHVYAALVQTAGRPGRWMGWAREGLKLDDNPYEGTRAEPEQPSAIDAMARLDRDMIESGRWTLLPPDQQVCPQCLGYGTLSLQEPCEECRGDGGAFTVL